MARAKSSGGSERSDENYNARRRFYRAAQRNLQKAERATGATADRLRTLAKQDLSKALDTYDKETTQDFSKPIQNLAEKLGVNLSFHRSVLKKMSDKAARKLQETAKERSTKRLESALDDAETRRQSEAEIIFSTNIGSRIIGGLVDVWREKATVPTVKTDRKTGKKYKSTKIDKEKMFQAMFDYFKVSNLADLLQKVEKSIGKRLYENGDTDTIYETVKLLIQGKVADNTLVA